MSLVHGLVPDMNPDASKIAMLRAQEVMASVGVTSFHDMYVTAEMYEAYRQLDADGDLRLRARLYLGHGVHDQLGELADPTVRVRVGGVKLISDGSIQLHTAALTAPYHDLGGCHCGGMAIPAGALGALVEEHHAVGRQVAIHTNGDQAIDFALDAIAAARTAHPDIEVSHRLEHVQTLREDQIARMVELGVGGVDLREPRLLPGVTGTAIVFSDRVAASGSAPWRRSWRRGLPTRCIATALSLQ